MSQLENLQRAFKAAVLNGDSGFLDNIESTSRVSASQRVSIYSDAYRLRLLEALEENYPGVAWLLGDDQFDTLGRQYIQAHPSTFTSIRWFGDHLVDYVQSTSPWSDNSVIAEMAQLDWTMTLAFDAPDVDSVSMDVMSGFTPEQWPELKFTLHPSVHRLDLFWSVATFRDAVLADDDDVTAPERGDIPVPWLIWRQGLSQHWRSMDVDEAWALDQARTGCTFGDICGGLTEWVDATHAPARAAECLKKWLIDELITDVYL